MSITQVVEIWIRSLRAIFETAGVEIVHKHSPSDRANPSFAVTLRRGPVETDLIVWESGHADLSTLNASGSVTQKHIENLNDSGALAEVLAVLATILREP